MRNNYSRIGNTNKYYKTQRNIREHTEIWSHSTKDKGRLRQ